MDAQRESDLLAVLERARDRGLLGTGPVDVHLRHAQAFGEVLARTDGAVIDLGSGAGVPGLVLAAASPDLHVCLLDAKHSRAEWLDSAVEELGLGDQVEVICAEAQVAAHDPMQRGRYQAVVARGFGPPAFTAEIAAGFLAVGGVLVVSEPPQDTDRWGPLVGSGLGFGPAEPVRVGAGAGFSFVRAHLRELASKGVPRQSAAVRKRLRF